MVTTFNEFVAYCKTIEGETLLTAARGKPFEVLFEGNSLYFIPSSGKRRKADAGKTQRMLQELADTNDWSPGSYHMITFHASYILQVVRHWKENSKSNTAGSCNDLQNSEIAL